MHRHQDLEIITYVRRGAITHEDSLGNRSTVVAGDVQAMSAGSGIRHAEVNETSETTALYQIWLRPRSAGGAPSWSKRHFPRGERMGRLAVLGPRRRRRQRGNPPHHHCAGRHRDRARRT
jgi:redox-sensitive bicupin YhaK (pirin superfamily)